MNTLIANKTDGPIVWFAPPRKLMAVPLTLADANAFVDQYHRHNRRVVGHRFSVGATDGIELWGVAILGRTVARGAHADGVAEITRCAVRDGAPKGTCSFLYNRLWLAWKALGGTKCITYTLQRESGSSLKGLKDTGWRRAAELDARSPEDWQSRQGRLAQIVTSEPKYRWEVSCPENPV